MTRVIGVLLLAVLLIPGVARAGDLTLRDVIELHRAGLGEDLLIAVIEADGGPFKLTHAEILDLKSDGLSERVITALVRTGTRRGAVVADGSGLTAPVDAAPAVIVEQDVTQIAPTTVVVVETDSTHDGSLRGSRHRHDDDRRGRDGERARQLQTPPATWVTRSEDGQNISTRGRAIDSGKPPATWVTPHDIRTAPAGFHPGHQDTPRRGDDRDSRRDDRRDDRRADDRKPKP